MGMYALRDSEWLARGRLYGAFSIVRNPCWSWRCLSAAADPSSNFWWADALEFA